jgi:hypothetical protein
MFSTGYLLLHDLGAGELLQLLILEVAHPLLLQLLLPPDA